MPEGPQALVAPGHTEPRPDPPGRLTPWTREAWALALEGHDDVDPELGRLVQWVRELPRSAEPSALEGEGVALLVARGVLPRRSKLTPIYLDLHRAAAVGCERLGDAFGLAWSTLLEAECSREAPAPAPEVLSEAGRVLAERIELAVRRGRQEPALAEAAPELRDLRLAGAHLEVLAAAAEHRGAAAAFEVACSRMHLSADTAPLHELGAGDPGRAGWTALYEYAAPRKFAPDRVAELGAPSAALKAALCALAHARDQEVPMHLRLHAAGRVLARPESVGGTRELLAVTLLGFARWLFQAKRREMAEIVLSAYECLSRSCSGGTNPDVLGFGADMQASLRRFSPREEEALETVPRGRAGRTLSTTLLLAELVGQLGLSRTRQLFKSSVRARRLRDQERLALLSTAVRHVGTLKGPILKAAQQISYMGLELDPEAERALAALQDRSTPVRSELLREVLREELGPGSRSILDSFSERPIGVGSIGQVHAARLANGERVAVKVQFPGIEDAVRHDMWQLGLLVPLARALRAKVDWRGLIAALEASFLQECDYLEEATTLAAFGERFAGDPVIRIPRVFPEHSSRRVLTMSRALGAPLSRFIEDASYAQRRSIADALLRLMFAFVEGRYTWSDPHPGNYLVCEGTLQVMDFGCVSRWAPERRAAWLRLGAAMTTQDEAGLRRGIRELGFPVDPERFDYDEFVQGFHPEAYGAAHDERGVAMLTPELIMAQLMGFFSRRSDNFHNLQMPPDLLLGLRGYYGTMFLLAQLRTGVDSESAEFRAAVEAELAAASSRR